MEWRGLPQTSPVKDTYKPVSETLAKVMAGLGLKDRLREEEVLQAWGEIVGEFIAANSSPQSLKDGILYIRVLQSTVHFELDRIWKPQIIKKFKDRFGTRAVRDIKFRLG